MQTSYALISAVKQRIAALDSTAAANPRQPQNGQGQIRPNNEHVVERRKLLQRFRQFLGDEERFWSQLLIRMQRLYALTEAQTALVDLGILTTTNDGQAIETATPDGRTQNQFPIPDTQPSEPPQSVDDSNNRLAILSKALICLGDIARYREQYREVRIKSGSDDTHGKRGKNRKPISEPPQVKNYARAKACYEQARLVCPHQGNPFHQLAILSAYEKDPFASMIYYYRALCVAEPYETASENLDTVLMRTYDQWKRKGHGRITLDPSAAPNVRIRAMTDKLVVLHALWRFSLQRSASFNTILSQLMIALFQTR